MKLQLLIIVLATALAYSNIFANGLVIDDQYFIKERNPNPPSQQGVYRPMRSLLYLVYYRLWGTNPVGYHLHSLVVHLLATVLVYGTIRKIGGRREMGLIGGLLFGLHPVHTESITYIAASMEMTGVVFFLAAFYSYLRHVHSRGVILAALAYFTYEMTLTLPLLILVYEVTLGRSGRLGKWGEIVRKTWPYAVAAGVFLAVRLGLGVGLARGDYLAYSFYHTQLTMTKMWLKYIWLLVWPVQLSHNQTVVPGFEAFMTPYSDQNAILRQSILDPEILLAIGVIGGIGVIGWKIRKIHPIVSFSVFWFFISLLPVAYIFPQGTAIAEKYLYLASVAWVILLAYGLGRLGKIGMIGVIIISLFYGGRTYLRNRDWRSPRALWEYETRIHPQSELAYYNLGIIYAEDGEKDKAMAAYQKVLQLKPQFWQAEHNLDNLLR